MKKLVQISVVVVLVALLLTGSFLAVRFYNRPMAEPMKVQIPENSGAAPTSVVAATAQAKPVQKAETCGQSGVMRLLFVGASQPVSGAPLGAESVRVVKVDYDQKKVVVVAFPRDLLLRTPALADLSLSESRLGPAYFYRKEATKGEEKYRTIQATELIAQTLYDNFAYPNTKKDYYYYNVRVNEMGKMIDTIGGVDITLPETLTNERNVTFPAGKQILNGDRSIEFVNTLQPGGEPARLARQNMFAKALQAKALKTNILAKMPDLYKQYDEAIVTDLTPKQIVSLACMANGAQQVTIEQYEISVENGLVNAAADGALVPDITKIKASLATWFGE